MTDSDSPTEPNPRPPAQPESVRSRADQRTKFVRRRASSRLESWTHRLGNGLLCGSLVLAAFIAYAFTTPAIYRSSALVWLETPKDKSPLLSTEPLASSRKLRAALLGSRISDVLRKEFPELGQKPAELVQHLSSAIDVSTPDGRAYSLAFQDSDRFRAQRVADALARVATELLPEVIVPEQAAPPSAQDEQQTAVAELAKFMAAHPEVAQQPTARDERAEKIKLKQTIANDAMMAGLYRERARITERLGDLEGPKSLAWTDNPYEGSALWSDPSKLKLRLAEIDRSLEARRKAIAQAMQAKAAPELPPALVAEWKRLLELAGKPAAEHAPALPPKKNGLYAKIARSADLPSWPVEPNRLLLIWLGGLLGLGVGALIALWPRRRAVRPAPSRHLTPWPAWPPPAARPQPPAIARSLPLPRARQRSSSPAPLALVRPVREVAPLSFDRPVPSSRRNFAQDPVGHAGGQMIPIRRSSPGARLALTPAREEERRRDSRPRQTLMFGSVEGTIEAALENERAVAIELRFDDQRLVAPTRGRGPAGVVAHPLGHEFQPSSLSAETRAELAREIYLLAADGCVVVAVSGAPLELKSRFAAEVALALASLDSGRVLLVEGNFERPAVARLLGVHMPNSFGFSRQLRAHDEAQLEAWNVVRCLDTLDVLAEGVLRSPTALKSDLAGGIRELRTHYAYIVIDGPALHSANDCRQIDAVSDALVLAHAPEAASELSRAAALFGKKRFSRSIEVR